MNKFLIVAALLFANLAQAQIGELTLVDIIDLAKDQSTSSKAAETRKQNLYWQYRNYRANYNPSLNLIGNVPGYNRDYFSNRLDDGQIVFQSREQVSSSLNLGLVQPISFTGGQVSVNSRINQFKDLNGQETQWNSTWFNVEVVQPVFSFNPLKWDKRTEPLRYEESKRSYVEEMEFISRSAANLFFDYLDAQINLQIASFNLANNDTIYHIEQGRYNIGTTSKDKLLQVELQLLRSQQDVAQARLDIQTARLALASYIGIMDTSNLTLIIPEFLPDFQIDEEKALTYARANRADFIAFERRRVEAEREVVRAKTSRFATEISASYGLNNAGQTLNDSYINPNNQQRINVTLSMPIVDWGRTRSRVQTAAANERLTAYILAQDIQTFEQEVVTQVRTFEVLRKQVEITMKSNAVAQERYEAAQNRYLIGKIDITNLNIALTEKDNARRGYMNALRVFWSAYFDLRRLTLYDFVNNELLYQEKD